MTGVFDAEIYTETFLSGVLSTVLGLTAPWADAQTASPPLLPLPPSGPVAEPPDDLTVPLQRQINRNPAYRERLPDTSLPTEPDPRDSTVRPVQPPAPEPAPAPDKHP